MLINTSSGISRSELFDAPGWSNFLKAETGAQGFSKRLADDLNNQIPGVLESLKSL